MPDAALRMTEISQRAVVRLKSLSLTSTGGQPSFGPSGVDGGARLLSLGPGEWWVVSDTLTGRELSERLRQDLEERAIASVDLSSALKVLRIQGRAAGDLLAKGCGLDLSRHFPPLSATRTRFAHLAGTLECVDPSPCFELYVGRSYFEWLKEWLDDAAIEFQHSLD